MSRYRPRETPGSRFITPEGHARLRAELEQLWRVERPQVTQAVSEAAAQGDRSENAEYTYGKRRLREIDRRVRFLRQRLEGMVVVDRPPSDRVRIVGPDEFDAAPGYISMDAPLARALLGKRVDDEVVVHAPEGKRTYAILVIEYPS